MSDWKIDRKGTQCGACGKEFAAGETFVSAIWLREPPTDEGAFERKDACPACFEAEEREPFSRWVTRLPPEKPKGPLLDLGLAREFLLRLVAEADPERRNVTYVLALLLLRKRRLKLLEQRREGDLAIMTLRVTGTDEGKEFEVPAPEPTAEETEEITAELSRLFGLGDDEEDGGDE